MALSINANPTNHLENETFPIEKANGRNPKTIFAKNTNLTNDPIAQKRKEAQEKAWKVISDAWDIDKSIDQSVEDRKNHYNKMLAKKEEAQTHLRDINEQIDALKKEYDITEDMTYKDWPDEYKQRFLELNKQASVFQEEINDADKYMKDDIKDIKAIAIERLKSDPMADANKTADAIIAAYSDDIIGMVMQEGKEHLDKEMDKVEEKMEENAQKEELKEEKLEDIREIKALQEALIEGTKDAIEKAKARHQENDAPNLPLDELIKLTQTHTETDNAQKTLDEIKYSMNLLEADLKGIEIDEQL